MMVRRHKRIEKSKTPIEEIITSTPIDENAARRNIWIEGIALAMPLVVSFSFFFVTVFNSMNPDNLFLSPPEKIESLVIFVFAFIIIYGVFLIFEYKHLKGKLDSLKKPHAKKKK